MNPRDKIRGAHACGVLVAAFCGDELLLQRRGRGRIGTFAKFANAKCIRQHATSVRSPEQPVRRSIAPVEIGAIP